jgi:Spy/CpxP family protein refolding chaperone
VRASLARRLLVGLLVSVVALTLPAGAQEIRPTPRGERIVEALLIWRLVDELDLTEGQIAQIFPRIKALKSIRIEMGRRVPPLLREIRHLTRAQPRDDEAIRLKVAELNLLRSQMEARRRQQLHLIAQVLTPEQLGKFALIQETFEAETLRLLHEMLRIAEEQSPGRR